MSQPVMDFVGIIIGILFCAGFFVFGLAMAKSPEEFADWMYSENRRFYGERLARRTSSVSGVKIAAWSFLIMAPIFVVVLVIALISRLLGFVPSP